MTDITLEQRARELLAAEMDVIGSSVAARMLLDGWPAAGATVPALRAIEAALRLSAGADLEQFREAVMVYRSHLRRTWKYSGSQGHDQATEGDRLLAIIDAAAPRHETGEG